MLYFNVRLISFFISGNIRVYVFYCIVIVIIIYFRVVFYMNNNGEYMWVIFSDYIFILFIFFWLKFIDVVLFVSKRNGKFN